MVVLMDVSRINCHYICGSFTIYHASHVIIVNINITIFVMIKTAMVILNNGGYIDAINLDYVMVTYLYPCGIYYRQDADYY